MIHPILSIKARIQRFILNNFKYTPYGIYMKKIHNSHMNESCFIIGNGPSLSYEDLNVIEKCQIDTFAVNRVFKIFEDTNWRPTYYVSTDHVLIKDTLNEVNNLPLGEKFIPLQNKYYLGIDVKNAHYFYRNDMRENDQEEGFSLDCTEQVNMRGTVTVDCIQLAIHMGYRYIYLLGVDHNFDKVITENGEIIINPNVNNYFCDAYDADVVDQVVHNLGITTKSYRDIKKFCDLNNIKIINATRKTKLDVFQQISFEEAIRQIEHRKLKQTN